MNNLPPSSGEIHPSPQEIHILIKGLGHVPSFKNTKSIFRRKGSGVPFIMTNPARKEWMDKAIQLIESQLRSKCQTIAGATATEHSLHSWIASSMPLDDSRQWIPEIHVTVEEVPKGEEGAEIKIERL